MTEGLYTVDDRIDLALAAELQAALLPRSCPTDCPHEVAAARNRMCGSVGGDFYDFIRINDDQIALIIGDVVGHGIRAAMVMARLMGYLHSKPAAMSRPTAMVAELNTMLIDLGELAGGVLPCSMFYAVIDAPSGVSFYINTGHPRPFICEHDKCVYLHAGPRNLLLGVEEFTPEEGCHTFVPGQRLVLYTDGILDATDGNEYFGRERFHQAVSAHANEPPDRCADAVFEAVEKFRNGCPQKDDETIVVIDRV
jgi:sigma-B regulation protein RsbU (phosphoserine phosphatase)